MVRMGTVWDRTVEVLNGRTGMIASIALVGIVVPSVVRDGYVAFSTPGTSAFALIGGVLSLIALLAMIWAQLAIVGIASDPATTRDQAARQARTRVAPAFGITLLIGLVATVVALPPLIALNREVGLMGALAGGTVSTARLTPGTALFVTLYFLIFAILAFWLSARLVLLHPVIYNERLGLGAIRRSFALTRGLTWRIIGLVILFAIVLIVAAGAAEAVTGVVFRLALGESGKAVAAFLAGLAGTLVTAAFTALAAVFTAQLYVAITEKPTPA